jgi:hypothetical protein
MTNREKSEEQPGETATHLIEATQCVAIDLLRAEMVALGVLMSALDPKDTDKPDRVPERKADTDEGLFDNMPV